MKRALAISLTASCLLGATSVAFASDGVITFNGKITASSCVVSIGGTNSPTITLPTVSKTALKNAGDTAGQRAITMSLTGCPTTGKVRAYFEPINVDGSGNLTNTATGTPAQSVAVQLVSGSGAAINLKDSAQPNNTFVVMTSTGTATLNYGARYFSYGSPVGGDVQTQAIYSLNYQ